MLHNPLECRPLSVDRVDAALVARGEDIDLDSRARLVVGYACALRDGRLKSFMGETASTRRRDADIEDAFEALPEEEQVLALGKLDDQLTENKALAAQIASLTEPTQSPEEEAAAYRRGPPLANHRTDRRVETWLKNARMMCSLGSLLCGTAVEKWRDAKAHIPGLTWKLASDEDGSDGLLSFRAPRRPGRGRGVGSQEPATIARVWIVEAFLTFSEVTYPSEARSVSEAIGLAMGTSGKELSMPEGYDAERFRAERKALASVFPCDHSTPSATPNRNFSR